MMYIHRLTAFLGSVLLLYIALTGAGIQLADMRALLTHAPETDPDMLMIRQHVTGPPNYAVVSAPDYTAPALPRSLDLADGLERAAALGRASAPGADLRLVELRMAEGRPAAHVQMGPRQMIFDLTSGAPLPAADLPPPVPDDLDSSVRSQIKHLHRFNYLGQQGTALDALAGMLFATMIVTGLLQYFRLLKARTAMDRPSPLWRAGGLWRDLHRWSAVLASVFVVWIVATGFLLALDNVGAYVGSQVHRPTPGAPSGFKGDLSSPINDAELPAMTQTTLAAFAKAEPDVAIKVLRLRYFVGYPQGVVVAADRDATQRVFNAKTGQPMSMSEPGYPFLGFPSGWEWHQRLKRLHRGDFFGMPGRWLDTVGALALVYLSVSGVVMYVQLWLRRRRNGRSALIWG
ncbi:MAG TPA: PepSY-associated TM helix domain-containing protein [Caulobacteraceae bacterium]|nr:PepSY-associated TM helix domain-containing protein [Caulobacteraceae bacterium]